VNNGGEKKEKLYLRRGAERAQRERGKGEGGKRHPFYLYHLFLLGCIGGRGKVSQLHVTFCVRDFQYRIVTGRGRRERREVLHLFLLSLIHHTIRSHHAPRRADGGGGEEEGGKDISLYFPFFFLFLLPIYWFHRTSQKRRGRTSLSSFLLYPIIYHYKRYGKKGGEKKEGRKKSALVLSSFFKPLLPLTDTTNLLLQSLRSQCKGNKEGKEEKEKEEKLFKKGHCDSNYYARFEIPLPTHGRAGGGGKRGKKRRRKKK